MISFNDQFTSTASAVAVRLDRDSNPESARESVRINLVYLRVSPGCKASLCLCHCED